MMKIKFKRPTLYLSHSVRGDGSKTIEENCRIACRVGDKIERIFPEIDLYVPARGDLTLQILWNAKKVTIADIMYADLTILRACHGWLWIKDGQSTGCQRERDEALSVGLISNSEENTICNDLCKANYDVVRKTLGPIVEKAKEYFLKGNK
jgi:hypothetical protein